MAQLVEHLYRIQRVVGSSPIDSTLGISCPVGDALQTNLSGMKFTNDTSYGVLVSTPPSFQKGILSIEVNQVERVDNTIKIPIAGVGQAEAGRQWGGVNKLPKGINMESRIGAGFGQAVGG